MFRPLIAVLCTVIGLPLALAQERVNSLPECNGYCATFKVFVEEALRRRDEHSLKKLQRDLQQMSVLTEGERGHIKLLAASALAQISADRNPTDGSLQLAFSEPAQIEDNKKSGDNSIAATAAQESLVAEDVPYGSSEFEHCQRVILFARRRGDVTAVENLAKELAQMKDLSNEQRDAVKLSIASFLARTIESSPKTPGVTSAGVLQASETVKNSDKLRGVAPLDSLETAGEPATGEANKPLGLPADAGAVFSENYQRIRQRYLDFFLFDGMTGSELSVRSADGPVVLSKSQISKVAFGDQTLSMGQAMLTFAGEAKILNSKGLSTEPSELAIAKLLDAFDRLDAADQTIYGASKSGFFVRDAVHEGDRMGVPDDWDLKSDMDSVLKRDSETWANAMSIDQTTSLFVGWWAITKWSSRPENVSRAQKQMASVMQFLMDSKFIARLPNGDSIPAHRGPDFRFAAGFLCRIAESATGENFFTKAKIDITIKGDPLRFRDNNLGEFEIPGFKFPADMPVALSHTAVLALTPAALVALTAPAKIAIPVSELIPGADQEVTLPCGHLTSAHSAGDAIKVVCVHLTADHPAGDAGPVLPCTHVATIHPDGDPGPCAHMTAKHPGGDDGPTIPCTHIVKLHDHHWIKKGPFKTKVPCTHFGAKHPKGHSTKIPCVHLIPAHKGGHAIPCVHTKLEHPGGHETRIPCIHLVKMHPEDHEALIPCVHVEQAHPEGHSFNVKKLNIEIPLGEKLHSYSRHIALQFLAMEPSVKGDDFLAAALNSNHVWSALLRSIAVGDVPANSISAKAKSDLQDVPGTDGPSNVAGGSWVRPNRWERCTELTPDEGGPFAYNGLDVLSLEILARLSKALE